MSVTLKRLGLEDKQKGNRAWRRNEAKWKNRSAEGTRKFNIHRAHEATKVKKLAAIEVRHEANRVRSAKRRAEKKLKVD